MCVLLISENEFREFQAFCVSVCLTGQMFYFHPENITILLRLYTNAQSVSIIRVFGPTEAVAFWGHERSIMLDMHTDSAPAKCRIFFAV